LNYFAAVALFDKLILAALWIRALNSADHANSRQRFFDLKIADLSCFVMYEKGECLKQELIILSLVTSSSRLL
jgi:hypothetical protein